MKILVVAIVLWIYWQFVKAMGRFCGMNDKPELPCHDQGDCLSCTNWEECAEIC